jgi:hypothetical protein
MQGVETVVVASLQELIEHVTPQEPEPSSGRRRGYSVYRGALDGPDGLRTGLDRLGGPERPHAKGHLEEHILRNFVRYATPYMARNGGDWEHLFTAQHHGLPTRLLDWSYSPLVAAHFATLGDVSDADRVIWQLDWRRIHERFGLRPLAFLIDDLEAALRERGIDSLWDFMAADRLDGGAFACMLEPPALDARITVQSAGFTICSDRSRSFGDFLAAHDLLDALTRIVVPAASVELVRDQLDLCGIDERRLFPDLDGVAREVRRYYSASAEDAPLRGSARGA